MAKKRGKDDGAAVREQGGLADSNAGIILADVVATRSWPIVLFAILTLGCFFRVAIGLGGYSGKAPLPLDTSFFVCCFIFGGETDFRTWDAADVWRL
jgi:hypothetical protein